MQPRLSSWLRFTLNSSVLYHSISARVWESAVIRPSTVASGLFCRTMWSCWSITFIVDIYNMMDFQYFQRPMKHFLQTSCWTVLTWQRYVYTMLFYAGLDLARKVDFNKSIHLWKRWKKNSIKLTQSCFKGYFVVLKFLFVKLLISHIYWQLLLWELLFLVYYYCWEDNFSDLLLAITRQWLLLHSSQDFILEISFLREMVYCQLPSTYQQIHQYTAKGV